MWALTKITMKRSEFLATVGAGAVGIAGLSTLKIATGALVTKRPDVSKLAVDINSINGFAKHDSRMTVGEMLRIYHETGTLIYDSNRGLAPMIISGEAELIEFDSRA